MVQKADAVGRLGELIAVKLTLAAAHAVAKHHAPAKVHFVIADKSETPNVGHFPAQYIAASCIHLRFAYDAPATQMQPGGSQWR